MIETYIKNNKLISEKEWHNNIFKLETKYENLIDNKQIAIRLIQRHLTEAIKKRATNNFAILLSGGLDSNLLAIIAKNLNLNFTCYSLGLEDSEDLKFAIKLVKKYKLRHKVKIISLKELEDSLKQVIQILKSDDVVKLEIGVLNYLALKEVKKDNFKVVLTGLGAEEMFGGYQRHQDLYNNQKQVHEECWRGLKNDIYQRDLTRDVNIALNLGIDVRTPFLDEDVIKQGMFIHPTLKVDEIRRKIILQELALSLDISEEFALRPKKAAQYGSSISKAIEKLTKQNRFKYKKDYISSLSKLQKPKDLHK